MKKTVPAFILKCILAFLPFLILMGYTAFFPMNYMDIEYPMWKYQRDCTTAQNQAMPNNIRHVILGDSRAGAGVISDVLSKDCINLSLGGATSIEMYYALSRYLENHPAPDSVVIIFAPFHYNRSDNFWERTVYFNYLNVTENIEVFRTARSSGDTDIFPTGAATEYLRYKLRLPSKYLPAMLNSRFIGRKNINEEKYAQMKENQGYSPYDTKDGKYNYETHYTSFEPSQTIDAYMKKLLNLCIENDISVSVEQAPMNGYSADKLDSAFLNDYQSYMSLLALQFPYASINKDISIYDNSLFADASHLNESGAEKFSRYLKDNYFD